VYGEVAFRASIGAALGLRISSMIPNLDAPPNNSRFVE